MRHHTPRNATVVLAAIAAIVGVAVVSAGPLDPPTGPISGTYKTLSEVEPRTPLAQSQVPITISQPGSYYLTGNLFAPALVTAVITINAPGVTLDLNGFQIDCITEVGEATHAIKVNPVGVNCKVFRGRVIEATAAGIHCEAPDCTFTDLACTDCTFDGLFSNQDAIVERCSFMGNGGDGLDLGAGPRSVVRACTASNNSGDGFEVSGAVEGCVARENGGSGFLGGGSFIGCDSSSNDGYGINLIGGVASQCSTGANTTGGINVGDNALVSRCSVRLNAGPGIIMDWRGVALDNNCAENGGSIGSTQPNILVLGRGNRIEGNTCTDAGHGIKVDGISNIIVRNTCFFNTTNWSIVANNKVGPIVAAPNSIAISGDTGGAGVGSTNAWANITY